MTNVVKKDVSDKELKSPRVKKTLKKKPMRYKKVFRLFSIIMICVSIALVYKLVVIDILTIKYILIFVGGLFLIEGLILFVLNKRFKLIIKVPFLLVCVSLIGAGIFGIYNLSMTADFVERIVSSYVQDEYFEVYVLKDSPYQKIEDLNGTNLGYFDNGAETLGEALSNIKSRTTFKESQAYDDLGLVIKDVIDKRIDALFLSSSLLELAGEEYKDEFSNFRKLGQVKVSIEENRKTKKMDITKNPFLVYVSGIDTYGSVGTVSRSDVNILIAVNPKTKKVLLVNTPRDYYVKLHTKKAMDKLTHAGIYGVEESMGTLGDLYERSVDYYLKINFSSLIKLIDAIGGVEIESKYNFSYDGYTFKKGTNKLDGKAALAFSRCRKELPLGDVSRGENQEAVIMGIISKVTNPGIITKYTTILKTMENAFVTNLSEKDIYSFAKFQLDKNPEWEVATANVKGTDSYQTTYSAGKTKLYVMMPDEESLAEVKSRINSTLDN